MPVREGEQRTDYGTAEKMDGGVWRLRFTRVFTHPIDRVWRAVTEADQLAAWYPTTIEGERVAGAALRSSFPRHQAPPFHGSVVVYDPPSVFEFEWGPDRIRLELEPADGGTRLVLLDTLEACGKAARDATGWHTCLDALAAALDGSPTTADSTSTWSRVHPHYVEDFGPEGSSLGPPPALA